MENLTLKKENSKLSEYSKTGMFNVLDGSIFNSHDSFISDELGDYIPSSVEKEEDKPKCLKLNNLLAPNQKSGSDLNLNRMSPSPLLSRMQGKSRNILHFFTRP